MKKYIKITLIFLIAFFGLLGINSANAVAPCSQPDYSCQVKSISLDCVSEGVCPGINSGDPGYQECCKAKSGNTTPTGNSGLVPNEGGCTINGKYHSNCGNYQLNDFIQIGINISDNILKMVGSLALFAFILGGIMFLISAGNVERVAQAKKIIIGAVIGIVIVFTSWIIIGFVFTALGISTGGTGWANSSWFN